MFDSPSGGEPTKAPRWDLADTEGYGGGNCVSWCPWMFSGFVDIYIGGRGTSVAVRGAQETGACPGGVGAPSYLLSASIAS